MTQNFLSTRLDWFREVALTAPSRREIKRNYYWHRSLPNFTISCLSKRVNSKVDITAGMFQHYSCTVKKNQLSLTFRLNFLVHKSSDSVSTIMGQLRKHQSSKVQFHRNKGFPTPILWYHREYKTIKSTRENNFYRTRREKETVGYLVNQRANKKADLSRSILMTFQLQLTREIPKNTKT